MVQPVTIAYYSDVNVRAFALDINIDSNSGSPNFQRIRSFKVGESNAASPGYGIFPSRFRDFVTVAPPNWNVDTNYNPTTAWNEPETTDHDSGMGYPKMIVEMGTLYAGDANKPLLNTTCTLFKFDVNNYGQLGTFHITVKANALRGGVVNGDGNTITAAYEANDACFPPPMCVLPDVVSQPEATATSAITAAGFTLGTRTTTCSNVSGIIAGDIISTDPVAGSYLCSISVNYVVSTGPCCTDIPAILDHNAADANAHILGVGLTVGTVTYECNDACAPGKVCRQQTGCVAGGSSVWYVISTGVAPNVPASLTIPAATDADGAYTVSWTAPVGGGAPTSYQLESSAAGSGTTVYPLWVAIYNGTALSYAEKVGGGVWSYRIKAINACASSGYTAGNQTCTVSECLKGTATGYADWVKYRYPACWCFRRQCRGDLDGKRKAIGGYVSADDLGIFKTVYGLTPAQIVAAPCANSTLTTGRICGFCADLDHKNKAIGGRVSADDLGIFKTFYGQADANVKCCDTAAPVNDCTLVATDPFNFWAN